jgi:hypothetical protein
MLDLFLIAVEIIVTSYSKQAKTPQKIASTSSDRKSWPTIACMKY